MLHKITTNYHMIAKGSENVQIIEVLIIDVHWNQSRPEENRGRVNDQKNV